MLLNYVAQSKRWNITAKNDVNPATKAVRQVSILVLILLHLIYDLKVNNALFW